MASFNVCRHTVELIKRECNISMFCFTDYDLCPVMQPSSIHFNGSEIHCQTQNVNWENAICGGWKKQILFFFFKSNLRKPLHFDKIVGKFISCIWTNPIQSCSLCKLHSCSDVTVDILLDLTQKVPSLK